MTGAGGEVKSTHLIRDNLDKLYTLDSYMDKPATNIDRLQHMKQLLSTAMEFSLTNRQREVVEMYYIDEKKAVEIAGDLGISRQAVHKSPAISTAFFSSM